MKTIILVFMENYINILNLISFLPTIKIPLKLKKISIKLHLIKKMHNLMYYTLCFVNNKLIV